MSVVKDAPEREDVWDKLARLLVDTNQLEQVCEKLVFLNRSASNHDQHNRAFIGIDYVDVGSRNVHRARLTLPRVS